MSIVTKAELMYGVEVSPRRAQDAAALAAFLPYVDAVALDEDAAEFKRVNGLAIENWTIPRRRKK